MSKNLYGLSLLLVLNMLLGCQPNSPARAPNSVVVPTSDSTPPTAVGLDVFYPDILSVGKSSQPITIIAVSDLVTVVAGATDEDGGVKALKLWATYTYYKPGQTSGPGLATAPIKQDLSDATVGSAASLSWNTGMSRAIM